jgi:hypothetical protein
MALISIGDSAKFLIDFNMQRRVLASFVGVGRRTTVINTLGNSEATSLSV